MVQYIWQLSGPSLVRQVRRAQAVAHILDAKETDLTVDIGCGEGFISSHLLASNFVVGLDISKDSLIAATKNIKQSNVDFIQADVNALPLKVKSFDKVTCCEVLEHLPIEKQKALCNDINNLLKDNGTLLISVPYKEKVISTTCVHCGKATPVWGHLHSLDREKVTSLLPSNQFTYLSDYTMANTPLISLSKIFMKLPIGIWLKLNNILGHLRRGYWLVIKYRKNVSKK